MIHYFVSRYFLLPDDSYIIVSQCEDINWDCWRHNYPFQQPPTRNWQRLNEDKELCTFVVFVHTHESSISLNTIARCFDPNYFFSLQLPRFLTDTADRNQFVRKIPGIVLPHQWTAEECITDVQTRVNNVFKWITSAISPRPPCRDWCFFLPMNIIWSM